ncbi:MAG TPA: VOC family protein [Dehalococcoidia bacterium]|nr:VOC family protein [Dehalococcoidia bacterium]
MPLHRVSSITLGVPNVEQTADFYRDFNLTETSPGVFATADGGEQLRLAHSPVRRLLELAIGADDPDDVDRVASNVAALDLDVQRTEYGMAATDPGTGVRVIVEVAPRIQPDPVPPTPYNGHGRIDRKGRSPRLVPDGGAPSARPRKLGHVAIGSTNLEPSQRFFMEGIGFKLSDRIMDRAFFLRCSEDHHNLLLQEAPVQFLHHTSWQVEDVDEIGLGAQKLLAKDPARHVWGFGRHHIGSNFFWYFRDPAGNFVEYYADMDCIPDGQVWDPQVFEFGQKSLYSWGPPPPPSFLRPDDLAELMAGLHSAKG